MGGNKGMLGQIREAKQQGLDVGFDTGYQKAFDILCLVLRDPAVMGKNTFGPERLRKISQAASMKELEYRKAWQHVPESDYLQEKLDQNLAEAFGGELVPFAERYPYCKEWDYTKPEHKKQ